MSLITPLGEYIAPFNPVSNITPFTYRDGLTNLAILEGLRCYVNETLVDFVNTNFGKLGDDFETQVNLLLTQIETQLESQSAAVAGQLADNLTNVSGQLTDQNASVSTQLETMTEFVNTSIQSIIDSTISVTDPVMSAIITDSNTVFVSELYKRFPSIDALEINVKSKVYGAKGDGATDDTDAINAALAAAALRVTGSRLSVENGVTTLAQRPTVYFPAGTYMISSTLVKPQGVSIRLSHAAKVKASVTMTTMLTSLPIELTQDELVSGGTWDANYLAERCILFTHFAHLTLDNIVAQNATLVGIELGANGYSAYEITANNIRILRDKNSAVPVGSIGLLNQAGDGHIDKLVVCGYDIGIRNTTDANHYKNAHVWGFNGNMPSICFKDEGALTVWLDCYADSPKTYGWQLSNIGARLIGCTGYMNKNDGNDNIAICVQIDPTAARVFLSGLSVQGGDNTHRWLRDIGGSLASVISTGAQSANSSAMAPAQHLGFLTGQTGLSIQHPANPTNAADYLKGLGPNGETKWRFKNTGEIDLSVGGGLLLPVVTATGDYALTNTDSIVMVNSGVPVTITLPTPSAAFFGRHYTIKSRGTSTVTLTIAGAPALIDGQSTLVLASGEFARIVCDGGQWRTI